MSNHVLTGVAVLLAAVSIPAGAETVQAGASAVPNLPLHPPAGAQPMSPPRGPGGWHRGGQSWWQGSYRAPTRGYYLPSFWLNRYYMVDNWSGYGFARPGPGSYWVRYYDDAVLVDDRGMIQDSVHGVDWQKANRGPVPVYVGRGVEAQGAPGAGYAYGDDRVTYAGGGGNCCAGGTYTITAQPGSVIALPPGATTISFQSQPQAASVTTETTYYEDRPVHRAYSIPKARHKPKPRVAPRLQCGCR